MRSLRTPSLRRHEPSSLGVVTLNGRDHYLGHWPAGRKNAPEAVRVAYDRLIAERLTAGRNPSPPSNPKASASTSWSSPSRSTPNGTTATKTGCRRTN
jgi:hypothetical protein